MKVFMQIVISLFVLFIFSALLLMGVKNEEKVNCHTWQIQAKEYPGFYLTQWQKDQCDHYDITIDAPVK
jgi:uncharacterized alpha/beta hydrolase family protein